MRRPRPDDIHAQQYAYPASQDDLDPPPDSDLSNYSFGLIAMGLLAMVWLNSGAWKHTEGGY